MNAVSITITIMFLAGKDRRIHGKKEKKRKYVERKSDKPKFVTFQVFFPRSISEASITSH